jgi:hypothetical protein
MSEESVKWFRRERFGVAVDVKIERAPGYVWSWARIVDAACMLMSIAHELLVGESLDPVSREVADLIEAKERGVAKQPEGDE